MRYIVHKIKIKKKDMMISDLKKTLKLYKISLIVIITIDLIFILKYFI